MDFRQLLSNLSFHLHLFLYCYYIVANLLLTLLKLEIDTFFSVAFIFLGHLELHNTRK